MFTENLDALREVITAECERLMREDDKLNSRGVAEWLIAEHPKITILGLADLVSQEMERGNDDCNA